MTNILATLLLFAAGCVAGQAWQRQKQRNERKIVDALKNLTDAITKLQGSVDAAVTEIGTPHPTDAQVQAAADAVNAQSARLDAAVNPPTATP